MQLFEKLYPDYIRIDENTGNFLISKSEKKWKKPKAQPASETKPTQSNFSLNGVKSR